MATWPPAPFPQAPLADYSEGFPSAVIRTDMDAGPAKVRRRFTAAPRPVAGSLILSAANVATFDAFFVTTLEHGALPFDWADPRTGATESFRFLEPPMLSSMAADTWRVSFKLEQLP